MRGRDCGERPEHRAFPCGNQIARATFHGHAVHGDGIVLRVDMRNRRRSLVPRPFICGARIHVAEPHVLFLQPDYGGVRAPHAVPKKRAEHDGAWRLKTVAPADPCNRPRARHQS